MASATPLHCSTARGRWAADQRFSDDFTGHGFEIAQVVFFPLSEAVARKNAQRHHNFLVTVYP
jgi:hypothetical protein